MPSQTLGPKKGALTWVSWRERSVAEKDARVGCLVSCGVGARPRIVVGVVGR